ncbi:hypothetical protein PIB30_108079 [Stylosanthes scabra]|uniref:Uncharacterized protein n=1 Tax=Stylosanthes scabra TaxID=79078 RepID=A0ABU6WXR8_9FABA|nr:hypothetical protein [Stylosanthes scabra]
MPAHVHSLKELLIKKKSLKKGDTIVMTKECSEIIQRNLPTKKNDPEKGNSPSPVPPDKGSKKKSKEDKGKPVDPGESPHIRTTSYTPHPSVLVGSASKASSKDVSNHFFDPP